MPTTRFLTWDKNDVTAQGPGSKLGAEKPNYLIPTNVFSLKVPNPNESCIVYTRLPKSIHQWKQLYFLCFDACLD